MLVVDCCLLVYLVVWLQNGCLPIVYGFVLCGVSCVLSCVLFVVCGLCVCCVLYVGYCSLFVVCCSLFVCCRVALFVGGCRVIVCRF